MLHGIHLRLNSEKYCSTHKCLPLVLDKWSRIFAACEPTLSLLCLSDVYVYFHCRGDRHTYVYFHSPTFPSLFLILSPCTGLGTLTVLEEYGKLSGDSNTHCWQDEGWCLERMPLPAIGQEDMEQGTLSVKLDWIMELVYN